jgi:hypothetical protein
MEFKDALRAARQLRAVAKKSVTHVEAVIQRLERRRGPDLAKSSASSIAYYRHALSTYRVVYEEADLMVRRLEAERKMFRRAV